MSDLDWEHLQDLPSRRYDCGYCGAHTGPNRGYIARYQEQRPPFHAGHSFIYVCTHCGGPTFFDTSGYPDMQIPGKRPGREVEHVPEEVGGMYNEARWAMSVGANTAAVMACRKVLMNVAVAEGADENQRFVQYVDWLDENHYIPPGGRHWVDQIKDVGNEANHEIPHVTREQAERILRFTEGLLQNVYELRHEGRPSEPEEDEEGSR